MRITCRTGLSQVRRLRHALGAFLDVFALDREFVEDVLLASGEVLANAVEHGARSAANTSIVLVAHAGPNGMLAIEVSDSGRFVQRDRIEGRGFGLGIVRQIAQSVTIETNDGTHVRMLFEYPQARRNVG